jgi:hypothetical protein
MELQKFAFWITGAFYHGFRHPSTVLENLTGTGDRRLFG